MRASESRALYPLVAGHFLTFLIVGMPLPVLPAVVHNVLGYSAAMAGFAIGVHFFATVLFRGVAGRLSDIWGGKRTMMFGALLGALSGFPYLLTALPSMPVEFMLPCLIVGRIFLGIGHSMMGTSMLTWGFGLLGPQRAGRVISWSGMSMYASIACGAPLGLMLYEWGGVAALGALSCLLPLCSLVIFSMQPSVAGAKQDGSASSGSAFGLVWRSGIHLAMHGVGNAAITAFAALYFVAQGWGHAGTALTFFGASFILARILCGELPDKMDGTKLTLIFFAIESAGLALLGMAPVLSVAFVGVSLTGFGCSLIYPSIGVGLMRSVPMEVRGSAVGWFSAFQDISLGVTGPVLGKLIPLFGYPSVFYAASACAALGFLLVLRAGGKRPAAPRP